MDQETVAKMSVELRSITAMYGDVVAVKNVDLKVREKEFVTLLGPSGCGKTTTGRMLAKLTEPSHGNILFDGSDITHVGGDELRLLRRKIQIIFQDPNASLKVVSSHHKVACHL